MLFQSQQNVFRLSCAQNWWKKKKFPLKLRQQRLLKSICWSPLLPSLCCLLSPGSYFQHKGRLSSHTPAVRPGHEPGPKEVQEVGYKSPFGHFQRLLLGWPDCAALGSLHLDGGFTNRRWFPEAIKVPKPQAQFNPHRVWRTWLAWLCWCKGTFNSLHPTQTCLSSGWSTRDSKSRYLIPS